jgi:hypothetical protein
MLKAGAAGVAALPPHSYSETSFNMNFPLGPGLYCLLCTTAGYKPDEGNISNHTGKILRNKKGKIMRSKWKDLQEAKGKTCGTQKEKRY